MNKYLIHFPLFKALRAGFKVQSFKIHSTPLALWRGVGGEAFSLFTLTLLFTSCFRTETNGEFGGNWQMTEWKQVSNDSLLSTNETLQLHYTVHRDLIKFQKYSDNRIYYLATFHRTADSLVIDNIYHAPIDTLVPFSQLSNIGFDSTGRFRIVHLTSKSLILSNTLFRLTFRKY